MPHPLLSHIFSSSPHPHSHHVRAFCVTFVFFFCSYNEVENESHFLFSCNLYQDIRKKFFEDVSLNYPHFNTLNNSDKILFLFNNIDPFICKKLGYFTFFWKEPAP